MPGIYYGPYAAKNDTFVEPFGGNCGPWPLGHQLWLPDGRIFRHAGNDGTVEVAGRIYASALPIANHDNNAVDVARAIGATVVSATVGATAAAQDLYQEGYVLVNDETGEGHLYNIARARVNGDAHAAMAGSDAIAVNLAPGETIQVALVAAVTEITYVHNRFQNIIISPASAATSRTAGVSPGVCAADRYYWSQTKGPAAILTDGTVVVGGSVMRSNGTAGAVEAWGLAEAAPPTEINEIVGTVIQVLATTEYGIYELAISGD